MIEPRQKIKDFIILPRKIRDDYINSKLTKNEHDVLIWIFENTNPYNGFFSTSYEGLIQDSRNKISYDNMRKIISSLRKEQYIHFLNHKGRGGSFPIYPIGFTLTNKEIQTLDYLKNKCSITSESQFNTQPETKLGNSFNGQYHNFKEQKDTLIKRFSVDSQNSKITSPYNDNDNKNNNIIVNKKVFNESFNRLAYKKEMIPVNTFSPKNYEEEFCKKIATSLGETDMRFILSRLKPENGGFHLIERAWGIFEEIPKEKIRDQRKYFNKLIRSLKDDKNA